MFLKNLKSDLVIPLHPNSSCAFFATLSISLYFFDGSNIEFGIICSVLASLGFSGSLVFYNAFLPEIVSKDELDRVSARGYSFGYIGSVILLIICLVLITFYDFFGFSNSALAIRFTFLLVGIWWIIFSQITFITIPEVIKNGITGYTAKEGDAVDLVEKLTILLNDKKIASEMSIAGYEFVKNNFSWDKMATDLLSVINKHLNKVK